LLQRLQDDRKDRLPCDISDSILGGRRKHCLFVVISERACLFLHPTLSLVKVTEGEVLETDHLLFRHIGTEILVVDVIDIHVIKHVVHVGEGNVPVAQERLDGSEVVGIGSSDGLEFRRGVCRSQNVKTLVRESQTDTKPTSGPHGARDNSSPSESKPSVLTNFTSPLCESRTRSPTFQRNILVRFHRPKEAPSRASARPFHPVQSRFQGAFALFSLVTSCTAVLSITITASRARLLMIVGLFPRKAYNAIHQDLVWISLMRHCKATVRQRPTFLTSTSASDHSHFLNTKRATSSIHQQAGTSNQAAHIILQQ
jgi:hypothetical protein